MMWYMFLKIGMEYSLRSGKTGNRASARNSMQSSNMVKRKAKAIPFSQLSQGIDDVQQHHSLSENDEHEVLHTHNDGLDDVEDLDATISETPIVIPKPIEHSPTFGNDVSGRILEEVVESFIVKRDRDPPRIPLCRLMENETI